MFKNEVIVDPDDKAKLLEHIKSVNEILDKYPYESCNGYHTVTAISQAKNFSINAERWISCLHTEKEPIW